MTKSNETKAKEWKVEDKLQVIDENGNLIADCDIEGFIDVQMENAALIAEAPKLLAAVKSMFLYIKTYGGKVTENFTCGGNGKYYEDLITKAEGQ